MKLFLLTIYDWFNYAGGRPSIAHRAFMSPEAAHEALRAAAKEWLEEFYNSQYHPDLMGGDIDTILLRSLERGYGSTISLQCEDVEMLLECWVKELSVEQ